jgi:hypothetical protein
LAIFGRGVFRLIVCLTDKKQGGPRHPGVMFIQSVQPDIEFIEKCDDDIDRRWSK